MGVLTYSEMKESLKLSLSGRTALETPTDWYGEFLNNAYMQLCTRTRLFSIPFLIFLPELETSATLTTADGVAYVANPADLFILRGIWDSTNDRMLNWIPPEEYYRQTGRATTTAEGYPRSYTRLGTNIYLYPTPDAVYSWTCYYKKKPAKLTLVGDVTVLGSEWDIPIVRLATILGMQALKEYDFAEIEKKAFVEDVTGLVNSIYQEQRQLKSWIQPNSQYLNRWRG